MRVAVAFAILASLSSCKKKQEQATTDNTKPLSVALAVAVEEDTPDVLTLTGQIAADQRSEVTADTQGKVVAVLIERGQRVKMGQPVVQLDVRSAALSAREAKANLESARAQKQLAQEECKRTETLLEKGAITRSEYDRQATQCQSTLQQVSAAQARADMMAKSITDGLVRAPFDGVVTEKSVAPGEWVAPGRTLFTLVDDQPLKIELSVPEASVRAVQLGQSVELHVVAQPEKLYTAKVTRTGGEIGKSRSLIVEATLDPTPELVPGMFAEARLIIGATRRPTVPADAVFVRQRLSHVFVAVKGELQDRIIQTGPALADGRLPVLKGIEKGERVVAAAKTNKDLVDGARIAEDGAGAAPAAKPDAAKPAEQPAAKPESQPADKQPAKPATK